MKKLAAILGFYFWLVAHAAGGVTCTLPFTLTNGTTADATQVMANYNALVTCFANNTAASGVNADITSLTALNVPLSTTVGGSNVYMGGTSTGSANAQVVATTVPTGFALTNKARVVFIAGFTNTGATQLNVNSQGLTNVFRMSPSGPQALTGGEIIANNVVEAIYDGTQFELLSVHNQFGGFGLTTNISSAATTDLGTLPSHNANITGVVTITSFGSSASTTFPQYRGCFAGVLTLTYNVTSLILPGAANITTAANDCFTALYLGSGNWRVTEYVPAAQAPITIVAPNVQVFTSGTAQTYTTPTCTTPNTNANLALYLRIRMVGGGGGGGAQSTNNGTNGTDTSFGTATAIHGNGGVANAGAGGAGGTGGVNLGTVITRIDGAKGVAGAAPGAVQVQSGSGGSSFFGGAGAGVGNAGGTNAEPNSGSGGAGGGNVTGNNGAGGGAGEYVEFLITAPAATYTYTVGAKGTGGAAGGQKGGDGADGRIEVVAYCQ